MLYPPICQRFRLLPHTAQYRAIGGCPRPGHRPNPRVPTHHNIAPLGGKGKWTMGVSPRGPPANDSIGGRAAPENAPCRLLAINGCPHPLSNILRKPLILRLLQHSAAVGVGFIPTLAAADKTQNKYNAAGRAGINPAPTVDRCNTLITNALLTLTLCRDGCVRFRSFCVYIIFSATDSPVGDLRCQSKNRGVSCFSGFPCRDASLRNESCFFLVPAGRSLLRNTTVPERNRGRSPCITARVFLVFVGKRFHFLA